MRIARQMWTIVLLIVTQVGVACSSDRDSESAASDADEAAATTVVTLPPGPSADEVFAGRIQILENYLGFSQELIVATAEAAGVNLLDTSEDFEEQLQRILVDRTDIQIDQLIAAGISDEISRQFSEGQLGVIPTRFAESLDRGIIEWRLAYDRRGDKKLSQLDVITILGILAEQLPIVYDGDTSRGYFEMILQVGSPNAISFELRNLSTGKKNPLGGLGEKFFDGTGTRNAANSFFSNLEVAIADLVVAPQIAAKLFRYGLMFERQSGITEIKDRYMGMDPLFQEGVVSIGLTSSPPLASDLLEGFGLADDASELLTTLGSHPLYELAFSRTSTGNVTQSSKSDTATSALDPLQDVAIPAEIEGLVIKPGTGTTMDETYINLIRNNIAPIYANGLSNAQLFEMAYTWCYRFAQPGGLDEIKRFILDAVAKGPNYRNDSRLYVFTALGATGYCFRHQEMFGDWLTGSGILETLDSYGP